MTERWISQKKHYCQICNTWLSGHIVNVKKHEQSTRHLENARQQLKDAYQRHQDKQKHERLLERELQQMEDAAAAAMQNDEARLTSRGGGPSRVSGPSAYEQLQAQREEKARIEQFYNQRGSNKCARQATVSANSEASSSRSNGDAWEFVTDQGLPFFRNKITGDVSWTPPPGANYVAASAAVTAAAAAVPAAVAAANTATTAAAPARPALRILSVKKPVKQECPNTKVPVPPCTAGAPTAAASAAAAPTTTVCTAAAPAAEAPATPAGAEAQLASASAVPAAVVVERDAGVASSAAASTAPVHAARTAQTSAFAGVAAGVYAPVAAGGPVADAAFAPVEEMPDFIPLSRSTSSGSSSIPAGYVFKKGHRGLGFYKDRPPQQQHCHQQWQQRRGSGNRPVQHNWGHAQQRKQQSAQQQQQRTQYGQQLQQHTLQDRQQQQQQRTPLKRPREEADAESSSPPADAAAAIAAAAAEAAAAAATLWGPGAAATEEQDSRSGNEGGVAAGTVETGEGLALDLPKAPYRAPKTTADESAQVAAGGSHRSDNGTRVHGDNSEEAEEEREDATAAAAAEDEFAAATTQRRVVVQTEGPVIGPWVEAKEDGWDAIARRQQQEQEQLLLLQQQQQEDALEHGEERRVNAGVEQLRRLRAHVKRRGVHHDFSWHKDEEADYPTSNSSTSSSGQGIEIRSRQRPAASRQQQETE